MKDKLKQKIEKTNIFMVLGTKEYFEDPDCLEQVEYARSLKKPIKILLNRGVELPKDFVTENDNYQVEIFEKENEASYKDALWKLVGEYYENKN
jgi:hypothetical protein